MEELNEAPAHDMVLRGGTVVDGSGGIPFKADVAISDGRIVEVGAVPGRGKQEFDVQGKLITPGFVDIHTHYDGQITWESRLKPSSDHGVTTVVMGNCGVGFAPCRPAQRGMAIKLMEGVEDVPEVVMTAGIPWNWETFPEYLDALSQREADVDFGAQLPHSPLRVFVMGERGANMEPPTDDELAEMRRLTAEAVRAGAIGVSTSRNLAHRFRDGRLAPSVNTEADELLALAAGLGDADGGVFQLIPLAESTAAAEFGLMERLATRSGRPLSFTMMSTLDPCGGRDLYLDRIRAAQEGGLPIRGQFFARTIGILFGLDLSYHPFSLNPSYRPLADLPLAEKVMALRDRELRARLLVEEPEDSNPFVVSMVKRTQMLFPLGDPPNYRPAPEENLAMRAAVMGVSTRELIYDELLKQDGRAILYCPLGDMSQDARMMFDQPGVTLALGDGGAHYGMLCDASYPTYLLTRLVRDAPAEEALPLPQAIKALTRDPAETVGFLDRGLIRTGLKADLNVIDYDRLRLHQPTVARDLPSDGKRLSQKADGYMLTIVSGEITYREGVATGALPGRLIRGATRPAEMIA